jgi:hypothetical protein
MSHGKVRILGIFGVLLILISIGFSMFPLLPHDTMSVIHLIARQRTIAQLVVKDTLILAYRPADDHVQAISELQNALPAWEKVELGLQNGDTSLGISPNLPGDIKLLLLQAQSDFTSIDTSAHYILAHPDPIDQTQLSIVLQHERAYSLTMFQVSNLFDDYIHGMSTVYFGIEVAISVGLLILWIRLFRALLTHTEAKEKEEETALKGGEMP